MCVCVSVSECMSECVCGGEEERRMNISRILHGTK